MYVILPAEILCLLFIEIHAVRLVTSHILTKLMQ